MSGSPFKHLQVDKDRHGNKRFYIRLPGRPKVRIREKYKDENGSVTEEFTRAYHAAIREQRQLDAPKEKTSSKSRGGATFEWLVSRYYASAEFDDLDDITQKKKKGVLRPFLEVAGHLPYKEFRQEDVIRSRDKRKSTPAMADYLVKTLKRLFNWAIENKLATSNPTYKVPKIHKSSGWRPWRQAELAQYRMYWPLGTKPRLAIEILDGLGTRRSDTALIGPQHINRGCLEFTAYKGRKRQPTEVVVAIPQALKEALSCTEIGERTFLVKDDGTSYTIQEFGREFKKWCIAAGLPHCYAHGVRKSAAADHAEAGATVDELKAMFGWRKSETAEIYTATAQKRVLAKNAARRRQQERFED
jgi:integrase